VHKTHTFYVLDLVFMNSRSKQVYFISMYIRYVLDIHTWFNLLNKFILISLFMCWKIKFDKNTSFVFDKIGKTQKW